jgi:DNA-binding Xre family transcriptional regulator
MHHLFLQYSKKSVIIENNGVSVVYMSGRLINLRSSAIPGRAFVYFERRSLMAVSYKKLWKILIDKDIKKKDLSAIAGISSATITKMGKGGHVTTEVLLKICSALNCGIDDIMQLIGEVTGLPLI